MKIKKLVAISLVGMLLSSLMGATQPAWADRSTPQRQGEGGRTQERDRRESSRERNERDDRGRDRDDRSRREEERHRGHRFHHHGYCHDEHIRDIAYTTDPLKAPIEDLVLRSTIVPDIRFQNQKPTFVSVQVPVDSRDEPLVAALKFLGDFKPLYQLDPSEDLYLERVIENETGSHISLAQRIDNIPVFGSYLNVHIQDGFLTTTEGRWITNILPQSPSLTQDQAFQSVASTFNQTKPSLMGAGLSYFNLGLISGGAQSVTRLAWRFEVRETFNDDNNESYWVYFVDAQNGHILLRLENIQESGTPRKYFRIRSARNSTSDTCWWLAWEGTPLWFDENDVPLSEYPGTSGDPFLDAQDASSFIHDVYDYYYNQYDRNGWDNADGKVELMTHVGMNWGNASYSPNCNHIRFGDSYVTLDVLTHEYTHGIIAHTSNLTYADQSGALNESYADLIGILVDDEDWLMGEDIALNTNPLRDLQNPAAFGQPDHMTSPPSLSGFGLVPPPASSDRNAANDFGSVHTNSGINNKAGYLIINGGVNNGINIRGIGRMKASHLFYDVMTTQLGSSSQMIDARDVSVAQAQAYVRGHYYGFTNQDVCQVRNAYASVGLGVGDIDCDGSADNIDNDEDGDYILNDDDNCPLFFNTRQQDLDGDGLGDVCDPDSDGDGILNDGSRSGIAGDRTCRSNNITNCDDNCPNMYNGFQQDFNNNGIGDFCEDNDRDGVPANNDNCPNLANTDQRDLDGDRVGDACDADADNDGVLRDGDGSGVIGDHLCGTNQRTGCDDNCPMSENYFQTDSDNDGLGNYCDNCSLNSNTDQSDTDGDHRGDVCDNDDDNDGIADSSDSCPNNYDPADADIDGNGVGIVCDDNEAALLEGIDQGILTGLLNIDPSGFVRIPIQPCLTDACGDWSSQINVSVLGSGQFGNGAFYQTRIVDGFGRVVSNSLNTGAETHVSFTPAAASRYQAPDLGQNTVRSVFKGNNYYLEIAPLEQNFVGQAVPLSIRIER